MTRRFLLAVAVLLASAVGAQALEPVTVTIDSVSSTMTIRGIDISSGSTPTNVIISTTQLYRQVCVQNLDATSYIACSESTLVSITASSNNAGAVIAPASTAGSPAAPTCFSIPAGTAFYCKSSSAAGSTRAVIARGR